MVFMGFWDNHWLECLIEARRLAAGHPVADVREVGDRRLRVGEKWQIGRGAELRARQVTARPRCFWEDQIVSHQAS
jgi:hypothetical protein